MNGHFDVVSTIYDRVIGKPYRESLHDLLRLPTDTWLLDAGGGTGRVAAYLRPHVGRLVVSDRSVNMLKEAHKKGELLTVRAVSETLPFPDAFFGRILVVDSLHHFDDQHRALGELLRVLAPGGRLVIEEPDISLLSVKIVALLEKLFLMGSRFLRAADIIDIFRDYGLSASLAERGHHRLWVVVDK